MKKFISIILVFCMMIPFTGCAFADNVDEIQAANFVKVKIPFPDAIEDRNSWLTRARYKDTGEAIPLSMAYHDNVYATVPVENKDREIEAFVPEEIEFSDYDASISDFHNFKMLSRVGVIKGNEKGEANLYDNVTRAEAVAMVMRFIGLEKTQKMDLKLRFDDVKSDDWFYSVVMNAFNCGIVKGDSERTFSPNRDVTREEITVMTARALQYADLRCSKSQVTNNADEDKISDWAKTAYEYIGRNIVSDYDDTNSESPVRILNPQKAATRADVAYILNNAQDDCQIYASDLAEMFGFDKQMPVIDGSTSTYPFTQAVYNALFCNGETHPQFPQSHSKSHASYQRLINGEVDMLFASVYPASDILKMAEEKGVELELIPIAYDAMIFFTNKDNPTAGLTKEQITNIYVNNAYMNWSEVGGSNALMYPYCRNNDSGSHAQMEKHFLNRNEIHPEVQKETSYTMSNVLTDVMKAKTENPVGYGLGYSIYYYYHNMFYFYPIEDELKLLAIDGVMPTNETIADGSYPLSNNTYVVLRKDTPKDAPARKMAEFMLTEAGQVCVENAGYGRLNQPIK
ncbi:MAG: substrate-binding domain-containing protein [Clostridia bacterium]|nr:substrate-binding domain-containing protein [Clostridia bacterium]